MFSIKLGLLVYIVCSGAGVSAAFHSYNQTGLDDQCYTVNTYTIPELHKLRKTITLCDGSYPPHNVIPQLTDVKDYVCPDENVEVVVFAPNQYAIELNVSMDVYNTAVALNYTTALLLVENATKENFLKYARCPQLVSLFYDGDADPEAITSYDGLIYYTDIEKLNWHYQVVSYWVACEAYTDPMLSAVIKASPRRWAAGIDDLLVGPSDIASAEAMKHALKGDLLEESFNIAIKTLDDPEDLWGFGGFGSDTIGPV